MEANAIALKSNISLHAYTILEEFNNAKYASWWEANSVEIATISKFCNCEFEMRRKLLPFESETKPKLLWR